MAIRWTARLLSLALCALIVAIAIGVGPPPVLPFTDASLSLGLLSACLVGLLAAWKYEAAGAALALASIAGFYAHDYYASGFHRMPGGWVFPLLVATPLLYFAAAACTSWAKARGKSPG